MMSSFLVALAAMVQVSVVGVAWWSAAKPYGRARLRLMLAFGLLASTWLVVDVMVGNGPAFWVINGVCLLVAFCGARFPAIGLTGGIGSGKSTVSAMLEKRGAVIVDADVIARKVVEVGTPAYKEIVAHFGPGVLNANKTIDRAALGRIIFSDAAQRRKLNQITHPRIAKAMLWKLAYNRLWRLKPVIIDAPLLVDNGSLAARIVCSSIIAMHVDTTVQLKRVMRRDGIGQQEAQAKLQAQVSAQEREKHADHVIDNSGSPERLVQLVDNLWRQLRSERMWWLW